MGSKIKKKNDKVCKTEIKFFLFSKNRKKFQRNIFIIMYKKF